jgi:tRNA-modifying protein YgfZ
MRFIVPRLSFAVAPSYVWGMTATTLIDRALIRLSGDDVRGFLQGLVTNDVMAALPVWAGLLTPQGKVLFDFIVWADGNDLLIDCERDAASDLARRLTLYRLRRPITIESEAVLSVHWALDGEAGVPDPRDGRLGRRWLAEATYGDANASWHAHRLSFGLTEGRAELGDGTTLWLECNAREWHGVSFTKGCYVGQENTARMHHRGKVSRRLVIVRDPGDAARIDYPALGFAVIHKKIAVAD